jgi:hypothetical protein
MRLKRPALITIAVLLLAATLIVVLAPVIVATGLRFWAERVARREGWTLQMESIEAPLLRPVLVRNLRVQSGPSAPFQFEFAAARVELDLNLVAILGGSRRSIRSSNIDGVTLQIRRNPQVAATSERITWSLFGNLLADNFKFSAVNLHVENGATTVDVRDGVLTGSEMEAGIFAAREITIASPWFHKTFSDLRGATSWQESRLALGALGLIRGLDIDTMTVDLSRIAESRIGMEINLDAFGGKVRARVSSEDRDGKRTWDVAGNGAGVSLAQMSDALEWTDRASGSLHATKFTFRGELNDVLHATAAFWAEVSGLTWRDRTADTVMIGLSLNNRAVEIEQLYIKQRNNQLTLSGEFAWPEKSSDGIKPAFRGDLTASINDLGDFARLFGWSPSDFAGKLSASGSVSVREGKLGGQLSVSGTSLVVFRSPIESLDLKAGLEESRLKISHFELRQKEDFLRGQGDFALTGNQSYNAAFQISAAEIANYRGFIPHNFFPFALRGTVAAEWKGRGANGEDSGAFHTTGRNLRLENAPLVPVDAELAADYSPGNIFFREFHLWNARADLSAFVTVAKDYFQLQDLRFTLNGRPRLQGNVFLPLSLQKTRQTSRWLDAFSADPFFDVDLTLDTIDLGELTTAVKTRPDMSGQASAQLQLSGTPASLQGKAEFHLRDFVLDASPALTADIETQLALGMANLKASAVPRGSDPVKLEGNLPLQLVKRDAGYALKTDGPLSGTLNFPAIFLAKLPSYLSRGFFTRGILSGNIIIADSVQQPLMTGSANLVDGQLLRGPAVSAGVTFKGRNATVDFVHLRGAKVPALDGFIPPVDVSARGEIDFANLDEIKMKISPSVPILASPPALAGDDCVSSIEFYPVTLPRIPSRQVQEIGFAGSVSTGSLRILFPNPNGVDPPEVFSFCREGTPRGKTLLFIAPSFSP